MQRLVDGAIGDADRKARSENYKFYNLIIVAKWFGRRSYQLPATTRLLRTNAGTWPDSPVLFIFKSQWLVRSTHFRPFRSFFFFSLSLFFFLSLFSFLFSLPSPLPPPQASHFISPFLTFLLLLPPRVSNFDAVPVAVLLYSTMEYSSTSY